MQEDARWSLLKQVLIHNGWVWRDDTLYAPHETMWFQTSSANPDFAMFRDRMSLAVNETSQSVELDVDQAALHADLVSLVEALNAVLEN
ncbi:MAG: hypothetical protein WKG01_07360 [Kofleriaceae bacterium]